AAAVPADERVEHGTVEAVEAELIDVEDLQGALGGGEVDVSVGVDLREVTDATQQTVGDARGAARAGGDLHGGVGVHGHVEDTGRAGDHAGEIVYVVELHLGGEAETVTQRAGEHAGAGRRRHQREGREFQGDGRRARPLAHDDVDAEVLHRHVEHLLGGAGDAVDLVDEQDVTLHEVGEH